jgi:hypothetical protein
VNLLGAANEGAWYACARTLLPLHPQLQRHIDATATAKLQAAITQLARTLKGLPNTLPDELLAYANLLRELRNYGAHALDEATVDLEQHLTETGCRLILLTLHRHLTKLDEVTNAMLASASTAPGAEVR